MSEYGITIKPSNKQLAEAGINKTSLLKLAKKLKECSIMLQDAGLHIHWSTASGTSRIVVETPGKYVERMYEYGEAVVVIE